MAMIKMAKEDSNRKSSTKLIIVMCLISPVNSTYNGRCAEIRREDCLIDAVRLDFSTEGWGELGMKREGLGRTTIGLKVGFRERCGRDWWCSYQIVQWGSRVI